MWILDAGKSTIMLVIYFRTHAVLSTVCLCDGANQMAASALHRPRHLHTKIRLSLMYCTRWPCRITYVPPCREETLSFTFQVWQMCARRYECGGTFLSERGKQFITDSCGATVAVRAGRSFDWSAWHFPVCACVVVVVRTCNEFLSPLKRLEKINRLLPTECFKPFRRGREEESGFSFFFSNYYYFVAELSSCTFSIRNKLVIAFQAVLSTPVNIRTINLTEIVMRFGGSDVCCLF